jgi:hypothetical protein
MSDSNLPRRHRIVRPSSISNVSAILLFGLSKSIQQVDPITAATEETAKRRQKIDCPRSALAPARPVF